jgi:hypothetical protein
MILRPAHLTYDFMEKDIENLDFGIDLSQIRPWR